MRFFWLLLSIAVPLATVKAAPGFVPNDEIALYTCYAVACVAEIIFIGLCVAEFVNYHKEQEYAVHQKVRLDRDADIKKWRQEFSQDSLDLYEAQQDSLKRARGLAAQPPQVPKKLT